MKKLVLIMVLVSPVVIGSLEGCREEATPPEVRQELKTVFSPTTSYCNGKVRTFVTLNQDQKPVAAGFRFSDDLLHELPIDPSRQIPNPVLQLPPEGKITGIDHLEMAWYPSGHDPEKIYSVPHFDFNFFLVSRAEREAVIPGVDPEVILPQFMPPFYASQVVATPGLGVRFVDLNSPEYNGRSFSATFIYGYYHGRLTFWEPMVTIEFLDLKPNFSFPVKQPALVQRPGYYPLTYHIYYDKEAREYIVALEDLVFRRATGT